jgi:hypothetical protein
MQVSDSLHFDGDSNLNPKNLVSLSVMQALHPEASRQPKR